MNYIFNVWVNKTEVNYKKIQNAFFDFGMSVFDMTLHHFMNTNEFDVFTFGRPPIAIDIMTHVKGLHFLECLEDRVTKKIQGTQFYILNKNDLLRAKKASNRSKYQDDIDHLGQ